MTTEEKLKALGFKNYTFTNKCKFKMFFLKNSVLKLHYDLDINKGSFINKSEYYFIHINSFTELLIWNDFYEKQAKRIARRNKGRDGSQAQDQFHQAH